MSELVRRYSISEAVFAEFPGYVRGVVMADRVANRPSPESLIALLRDAEDNLRDRLLTENVASHPQIAAWREAFRRVGIKPAEFRPSVEALVRRVLRGDQLPSINALVDIGNIVSLRRIIPVGSHAIDHVRGDLELKFASGRETFVPFGSESVENPGPREIVFTEGDIVLTRRWVWRQATHTLTLPETTSVEFNLDGLPPSDEAEIRDASAELTDLVSQFCGGVSRTVLLSVTQPSTLLGV